MSTNPNNLIEPPITPHLAWLGKSRPRDKVLPPGVARAILARPVVVEEQPDGALIAIDFPDGQSARVSRRAHVLDYGAHAQFHTLWGWLMEREAALLDVLGRERVLFGQWCYATHSVRHDGLPDWFIVMDVFERSSGRFLSVDRRNVLARRAGLVVAPELLRSKVDLETLTTRLASTDSLLGHGRPAGLVVRLEQGEHLSEQAQLVRAELADGPADPTTKKSLERNALRGERNER